VLWRPELPGRGDAPAGELGEEEGGISRGLVEAEVELFCCSSFILVVVAIFCSSSVHDRPRPALVGEHRAPQRLLPGSQLECPGAQEHGEPRLRGEQAGRSAVGSSRRRRGSAAASAAAGGRGRGGAKGLRRGGAQPGAVAVRGEAADGGDVLGGERRAARLLGAEEGARRARGRGAEGAGLEKRGVEVEDQKGERNAERKRSLLFLPHFSFFRALPLPRARYDHALCNYADEKQRK